MLVILDPEVEFKSIELSLSDWHEIYYSVDSKLDLLKKGQFGSPNSPGIAEWISQLKGILKELARHVKV